jgi:hypothetical protein
LPHRLHKLSGRYSDAAIEGRKRAQQEGGKVLYATVRRERIIRACDEFTRCDM